MNLPDAASLAVELLKMHKLPDWQFRFDHARQRCGACHFGTQHISLSKHFVKLNDTPEVRATLLHEIAHALSGPRAGHGPRWQRIAETIGAPVQATNDRAKMPEPAWQLICLSCHKTVAQRHRRSLNLAYARCRTCGPTEGHLHWHATIT